MSEAPVASDEFITNAAGLLVEEATERPQSDSDAQEGNPQGEGPDGAESGAQDFPELDLTPEVPPDILEEIEKAEFDLDEPEDDDDDIDLEPSEAWEDDETKRLKAELRKLKKREKFLEEQNARTGKKVWAEEAARFFPLAKASLDTIEAKSRKAFLREAKRIHDQVLPAFETVREAHARKEKTMRAELEASIRQEMEAAWGRPTTVPDTGPTDAADNDRRMQFRTHKKRSLVDTISARIQSRG